MHLQIKFLETREETEVYTEIWVRVKELFSVFVWMNRAKIQNKTQVEESRLLHKMLLREVPLVCLQCILGKKTSVILLLQVHECRMEVPV